MSSTLGSLFDGSGGFPLAGEINGLTPIFASEVEPYPVAVTKSRIPSMLHLGDVSKLGGAKIPPVDVITFGSPCQDLSIAGKRAGIKHKGKGDQETTRSGLFLEAIRIIREMREATHGRYPTFAVWENVPGAFSSKKGEDFRAVLEAFCTITGSPISVPVPPKGKWLNAGEIVGKDFSSAWRLLDAQYWGVPQRRKRIYLVADFAGGSASQVLFDPESLPRDIAAGGKTREGASGDAQGSAYVADGEIRNTDGMGKREMENTESRLTVWPDIARALIARQDSTPCAVRGANIVAGFNGQRSITGSIEYAEERAPCMNANQRSCVAGFSAGQGAKAMGIGYAEEKAPTLKAVSSGLNQSPCICIAGNTVDREPKNGGNGIGYQKETAYTLNTADRHAVALFDNHAQDARISGPLEVASAVTQKYGTGGNNVPLVMAHGQANAEILNGLCPTLNCNHESPIVAGFDCRNGQENKELCGALQAKPNGGQSPNCIHPVRIGGYVRRLIPLECARLQGFPDGWGIPEHKERFTTEELAFWREVRDTYDAINGRKPKQYKDAAMLKWYNKLHTDSAEYKMWGNGIALPCAVYVLRGIKKVLEQRTPDGAT